MITLLAQHIADIPYISYVLSLENTQSCHLCMRKVLGILLTIYCSRNAAVHHTNSAGEYLEHILLCYFIPCRLLDSLTSFTDNLPISNSSATFTRKTYALQVNDIDTNKFRGQTLSVDLGSVQEAMSISSSIREEAIQTIEGNEVPLDNRTASVQVPPSVFRDFGQSSGHQRLSYSVFVRDTLFQSSDENQSNLTLGSIIVAVRVNGTTASGNLSTPITVTFQASEVGAWKLYRLIML